MFSSLRVLLTALIAGASLTAALAAERNPEGLDQAVAALKQACDDPDVKVRTAAAEALGTIGVRARDAAPAVLKLFTDDAEVSSVVTAKALGTIHCGDLEAHDVADALVTMLGDEERLASHYELQATILQALGRIGPAAEHTAAIIGERVTNAMRIKQEEPQNLKPGGLAAPHCAMGLLALSQVDFEGTRTLVVAREALHDPDHRVSRAALVVLGDLGNQAAPAVPDIIPHLENRQTGEHAAITLGRIGPRARAAGPALTDHLDDEQGSLLPRHCQVALERIGFDPFPLLIAQLRNGDDRDMSTAKALAQLGYHTNPAVPKLIARFPREKGRVSLAMIETLGRIGPPADEAVPALFAWYEQQHWLLDRIAVMSSLRAIIGDSPKCDRLITLLIEAFADERPAVRSSAANRLRELAARPEVYAQLRCEWGLLGNSCVSGLQLVG